MFDADHLANLKFGHAILRNSVPNSFFASLKSIQNFFSASTEKDCYVDSTHKERGYRHLNHKEMFIIRDHHLPLELLPCLKMTEDLYKLSLDCLKTISDCLQLNYKTLLDLIDSQPFPQNNLASSLLRLIHYRDHQINIENACSIHQDLGLLTLVCPTTMPALEIYDFLQSDWLDIETEQEVEDIIVMAGESLSLISNGYFLPCTHRVRVPTEPRLSICYQLRFKSDAMINSEQLQTPITRQFAKPFCLTGEAFLQAEIDVRQSVNGSY